MSGTLAALALAMLSGASEPTQCTTDLECERLAFEVCVSHARVICEGDTHCEARGYALCEDLVRIWCDSEACG
jgi:hypothetical protein